jgi:hypothetical protein
MWKKIKNVVLLAGKIMAIHPNDVYNWLMAEFKIG